MISKNMVNLDSSSEHNASAQIVTDKLFINVKYYAKSLLKSLILKYFMSGVINNIDDITDSFLVHPQPYQ